MDNKEDQAPKNYSVDEILAEAKVLRDQDISKAKPIAGEDSDSDRGRFGGKSYAELIGEPEDSAPNVTPKPSVPAAPIPQPEQPAAPQAPVPEIPNPAMPEIPQPSQPSTPNSGIRFIQEEPEPPKKKRGLSALFGRFHKNNADFDDEDEEDIYYGMQLKPIDEYKQAYDDSQNRMQGNPQSPVQHPTATFAYLFDETDEDSVGDEIAARFEELHRERKNRVEKIMQIDQPAPETKQRPVLAPSNPEFPKASLKPVGDDTADEIFSHSPSEKPKSPVTAETQKKPESIKPAHNAKAKQKPKAEPAPVNDGKTTEYFIQIHSQKSVSPEPAVSAESVEQAPAAADSAVNTEPKQELVQTAAKAEVPVIRPVEEPITDAKPLMEAVTKLAEKAAASAASQKTSQTLYDEPSETVRVIEPVKKAKTVIHAAEAQSAEAKPQSGEQPADRKQIVKNLMEAAPKYLPHSRSVHVVELNNLQSVLESEAHYYTAVQAPQLPKEELKPVPVPALKEVTKSEKPTEHVQKTEPNSLQNESKKAEKKPEKAVHKFRISGEEEENDPGDELPPEPEELDDYNDPADAPSVQHELNGSMRELLLRFLVTGISAALLLVFGFLGEKYQLLPQMTKFELNPTAYLILNVSFVALAILFCWVTITNGLKALFTLQANSDSGVAVAAVAALAQSVAAFFVPQSILHGSVHLYSTLAVTALFLNTAGKLSMINRISRNFHFISSSEQKSSVELYDDYNTSLQLAKGCVTDTPMIAYQCKAKFFKHFLKNSYEPDPSESSSQVLAPIGFICSLILCIACLFIYKDVTIAITVFTAAVCVCTPFTDMLSVNLPISSLCAFARRCGAMLVGYQAIDKFCNTNAIMVDAQELFPKGTVVLNGIKTFGGQRIDEAIVDATALMCSVGGPLSDVFDQIIKSRHELLPKIDNPVYEDEHGVIGWVSGKRILVGNRDLLASHGIEPPSRDYEEKYLMGGKQIIYLASGGELVALFILSYNSDKRRALELRRMENNGISLIVRTCDPNITPEFLAGCFQLDVHSVRVLPERLSEEYKKVTSEQLPKATAMIATNGRMTSMMRILTACVRQKSNVSAAVAMQNVAVILGFALVAFLSCYSGIKQLSTAALLLYELFWVLAILLIPRLRKP